MGAKINQKSIQKWNPRWNAARHRFLTHFNGFWETSWEAKWTKNRSKKALEKGIDFSLVLRGLKGGVPEARHGDGIWAGPPKLKEKHQKARARVLGVWQVQRLGPKVFGV